MDPRRAGSGFREDVMRGETAERAVAPRVIEEAAAVGEEADEPRLWGDAAGRVGAAVVMMEMEGFGGN